MTGKFRIAHSVVVLIAIVCLSSSISIAQQSDENALTEPPRSARVALLSNPSAKTSATPAAFVKRKMPVPFSASKMTGDMIPPFAAHPALQPVADSSESDEISFEENMPVEPKEVCSIDDCCRELTEMIAGNLESEISLDAKKRMIETALKMVARNVALKAEAKIIKLKADHALEMARMQGQMGQIRSMGSAADQINRVAGPLSQMLEKNYQQAVAMNLGNQQLSQTLAQLGFNRLEEEAKVARANRQRIQLKTPMRETAANQWRVDQLNQENELLRQRLNEQYVRPTESTVQPAAFNQPLQPRRQPLAPIRTKNEYFDDHDTRSPSQWQQRR